jgi:hypothetical protein
MMADYHIGEVKGLEGVLRDLHLFDTRGARGEVQ